MGEQQMKRARHSGADAEGVARVLPLFAGESALFYDLDAFEQTLLALQRAFPPHFRHTLAVKANPLPAMLRLAVEGFGFGLECASLPEVELSLRAGCAPGLVMFDSPCKTVADLRRALEAGVQINCDSFDEVERVARLLGGAASASAVAVRINPLLGFGAIRALSVSDPASKFGVPLTAENEAELVALFARHRFLTGLHVHVGSQGCSLDMLAAGASAVLALARKLERCTLLDLGGGLPTNFASDACTPTFAEYARVMQEKAPELFLPDCKFTCFTEFGRAVHAKIGWAVSRCEYVKLAERTRIAVIHFGSDMFLRTCYVPDQFALRVQVFDKDTCEQKTKALDAGWTQNVVGPLCFGGDKLVDSAVDLPEIGEGDFVVVRDAGANCLSLWSRHCSRASPEVIGYRIAPHSGEVTFTQLRKRETLEHVLSFWE
ncbi:hypothetical protein BASA81_004191 [Batrachochytrium salamandrivorans]|nr:hypothetical protein BASA81_004191 [Batrachochytrium salamandrivorans]